MGRAGTAVSRRSGGGGRVLAVMVVGADARARRDKRVGKAVSARLHQPES
jgi:hypothetical protein